MKKRKNEIRSLIEKLKKMSETELRDSESIWVNSLKELIDIIKALTERKLDYGEAVYAMTLCAEAVFNYAAHKLGATGFQAEYADLEFLKRTRNLKHGFRIIDYEKLLYPQYYNNEDFPTKEELLEKNLEHLAKIASQKLKDNFTANHSVLAHWKMICDKYYSRVKS